MRIPDWPGFKRLSLDEEQMRSLDACSAELIDLMGEIANDFPKIKLTDQGGELFKFVAKRAKETKTAHLCESVVGSHALDQSPMADSMAGRDDARRGSRPRASVERSGYVVVRSQGIRAGRQ
jgi:hypothetical protein